MSRTAERTAESEKRAVARSATAVRRYAMWNGLGRMATLTFPGRGVADYSVAYRLTSGFLHKHGELIHDGPYVAVPELHPKGHGYHFHALVSRHFSRQGLAELREGWTRYLARRGLEPSGGARFVRTNVRRLPIEKAARYGAKYVAKTFARGNVESGRQRYLRSEGYNPKPMLMEFFYREAALAYVPQGVEVFDSETREDWGGPRLLWCQWKEPSTALGACIASDDGGMNESYE